MHIVNHSELQPEWNWLAHALDDPSLQWQHVTSAEGQHGRPWARMVAARRAVRLARHSAGLLVSHGPRPAMYAGLLQKVHGAVARHLVFSFNFTALPTGLHRLAMARGLAGVDRFVVSSSMERRLYAGYFGLNPARIDLLHWSIQPPDAAALPTPIAGPYVCAVGSQARDYAVLVEAMRRLPGIPMHIVCHPANVAGLSVPDNVVVHVNTTLAFAQGLTAHARLMVLPLAGSEVPCGHVTAVAAMHLGVPIIATDSTGLHDYLRHQDTALLSPPHDPIELSRQIEMLWEDRAMADGLSAAAKLFAGAHCTEANAVAYLRRYLSRELHH